MLWNGVTDFYDPFEDAGTGSNSSIVMSAYISSRPGISCNPNNPSQLASYTHPPRCVIPCVQYGPLDEPYFHPASLPLTQLFHAMCPCTNASVYSIPADNSPLMSE